MQIQLAQPRVLGEGKKGSFKLLQKGKHEISEAVAAHWFTQAEMKSGVITVMAPEQAEAAVVAPPSASAKPQPAKAKA